MAALPRAVLLLALSVPAALAMRQHSLVAGVMAAPEPEPEVAEALMRFYRALAIGDGTEAAKFFTVDGVYVHTGEETVRGQHALKPFLQRMCGQGAFDGGESFQIQSTVTGSSAFAAIVSRPGKRDSLFVENGKLKVLFTTSASPSDAYPGTSEMLLPLASSNDNSDAEVEKVKAAVDDYFDAFVAKNANGMLSAFVSDRVDYMFDFNPTRKVPFGCMMSEDCGTAPAMFDGATLIGAFQGFAQGYINLAHKFEITNVYGDVALVTTLSVGCEGDNVTPNGQPPMPNREIFVLVKHAGEWKIRSYMFTHDPASPVNPPVDTCLSQMSQ